MAPKFQKKPPVIYKSRKVDFLGEGRLVLHPQDAEGHCLLLALGNALLLNGSISLSPDLVRDDVPQEHLQLRLHMYYKKLYKEKLLAKDPAVIEDEMMPTIKCLSGPVDISINFMRNDGIKSRTVSLNIFDHMNIKIYHGWMISSEDVPISEIVGSSFHDVIRVDNPDPSTLIQNAGEDFKIFFAGPDLTTLGFQLLTESLENDSVCVLFWKRSFHTMVKLNDGLFVLQNDFNFLNTDIVWKELKSVRDDGRFCTASFQLIKHKCPSVKCQLEFISVMNLKRHNKGFKKKDDIGKFWNQLNIEESLKILSLMDNQIQELDSTYLIQLLPTNSEDPLTKKLLGIINGRQKKTWNEIFGILNEASEGTLFSFELQSDYNIGLTWEDMLSDSINFLPCYSYVMERILVSKWIDYQTKEASEAGELLLLEEKTKKHRRRRGKKAVDVSTCLPKSDKSAGNMSKSEDDFSSQIVHEYQEYSDDVNATIDMKLEEDVISKVSEEESAGEMPKSDFSSQIEHEYQEHSDDTSETTYNLHSVSGPSRQDSPRTLSCQQDRISLQDYVKVTKLTKVYTLKPRKFFRILKKAVKMIEKSRMGLSNVAARKALALVLSLNLMTCAGRFCSRGFMTYIVLTHTSNNKCWNGLWDLSDMELRNGKFIITKEATFDLTAERVLADFKRYFAILLLPYFYNNELKAYPLYFDEFRADMLKVPDPISNPGEFHKFEKYMAIHFVFVPPLSRSIFLVNLYKAFESVRFVADNDFHPLNEAMPGDWRQNVRSVPIVEDVYYHGVRVGHEPYTNSYFHLLRFARHFCNHDLDKAKVGSVVQPIMDLMVTDLILSQLVAPELTDLIFFIVKKTGMGGNLFRVFQALETSDGRAILFPEDDADELPDDSGLHPMTVKPHKKLLKAVLCPEDDADELPDDSGTSSEDSETLREIA